MQRFVFTILNPIHEDGILRLKDEAEVILVGESARGPALLQAIKAADAIVVRGTPIDAAMIASAPNLKVVSKHGVDVDTIDAGALTAAGVALVNTPPGMNAIAVAEGTMALVLAVCKQTLYVHRSVLEGNFNVRYTFRSGDLWGRTVGIVGLGEIGTHVARICGAGFGMQVIAYDPYLHGDEIAARGARKVERLDELLSRSDVVSVHAVLTEETRGMIGARELAVMKPSTILVNTARGPIVDEAALAEALRNKRIAGAGIDVFHDEPPGQPPADNPLLMLRDLNVAFSPHNAGLSVDAARQLSIRAVESALEVLRGRKPATLLNPEVWDRRREPVTT